MTTPDAGVQPPGGVQGPEGAAGGAPDIPQAPQASLETAWNRLMQRLGKHNPAALKRAGKALDATNNVMRSHR